MSKKAEISLAYIMKTRAAVGTPIEHASYSLIQSIHLIDEN